ncbi:MAG: outer membrane beta-barrel protein [Ignavibacteriaceae bacterium]
MNHLKSFLCLSLLLLFSISLNAQDNRMRIGFGVGFSKEASVIIGDESSLALPIDLANFTFVVRGKSFRFEPNIGFFNLSATTTGYMGTEVDASLSNYRLGAVIAYANAIASMNLYYGINIGVILSSISADSDSESKSDFFVGPAIGGEYMFSDNFSLGGEIQINYIKIGNFDDDSDDSMSIISSRGMIILRWYVN